MKIYPRVPSPNPRDQSPRIPGLPIAKIDTDPLPIRHPINPVALDQRHIPFFDMCWGLQKLASLAKLASVLPRVKNCAFPLRDPSQEIQLSHYVSIRIHEVSLLYQIPILEITFVLEPPGSFIIESTLMVEL
jgi:hypothetical protein